MELGERIIRARVIALTNIGVSLGIGPPLGGTLVASDLRHGGTTGGELEEDTRRGGICQVSVLVAGNGDWHLERTRLDDVNNTYEPPLTESVLLEGSLRPVVV